jgi:phospholipase/carboxylesterase
MLETIEIISSSEHPIEGSVICLHGLGADGNDLTSLAAEIPMPNRLGVRYIFPHAPIRAISINGGARMRAWYDIKIPSLTLQEDEAAIRESETLIQQLIEREKQRGIAAHNIILAGFSQGAVMTLQVGLRYPERLAGLIALSGYLPLQNTVEIERSEINRDIPIFMAHGTLDPIVPNTLGILSREKLRHLGYNVEWHDYIMGHQICPQELTDITHWMSKYL